MSDDDLFGDEHVQAYLESDGEHGHDWKGTQCLLLFTKGRKSGEERIMPLIYAPDGDDYVIVASKGGHPDDPAWYKNIQGNPDDVEIQVLDDRFTVKAHDADGEDRDRLWEKMNGEWPDYAEYQKKTDRDIPVVVLQRA